LEWGSEGWGKHLSFSIVAEPLNVLFDTRACAVGEGVPEGEKSEKEHHTENS